MSIDKEQRDALLAFIALDNAARRPRQDGRPVCDGAKCGGVWVVAAVVVRIRPAAKAPEGWQGLGQGIALCDRRKEEGD